MPGMRSARYIARYDEIARGLLYFVEIESDEYGFEGFLV